jgi:hypothetical protein
MLNKFFTVISILFLLSIYISIYNQNQSVFAQVDCYDDGTFGPTCAATIAPTQAPAATLPPTNTPPPELPRSGQVTNTLVVLISGVVFLLFGMKMAVSRIGSS